MNQKFWFAVMMTVCMGFSVYPQGNDPDEEPSLQTEDGGIKKNSKSNEITKLKADSKKKSKKDKNLENENQEIASSKNKEKKSSKESSGKQEPSKKEKLLKKPKKKK